LSFAKIVFLHSLIWARLMAWGSGPPSSESTVASASGKELPVVLPEGRGGKLTGVGGGIAFQEKGDSTTLGRFTELELIGVEFTPLFIPVDIGSEEEKEVWLNALYKWKVSIIDKYTQIITYSFVSNSANPPPSLALSNLRLTVFFFFSESESDSVSEEESLENWSLEEGAPLDPVERAAAFDPFDAGLGAPTDTVAFAALVTTLRLGGIVL
jgi:hypothetical protein